MRKFAAIAIALLILFSLAYILADILGYSDEEKAKEYLQIQLAGNGRFMIAGLIVLLLVVDIVLPIPSSVVMVFSGVAFGFFWGGIISFAGSFLAALLGFGLCRRCGQRAFDRLAGGAEQESVARWFEEWGLPAIVLSRSLPMLTEILSCLAGLSHLSWRLFCAACALGTLPICFVYSYAGSRDNQQASLYAVLAAMGIPALAWLATHLIHKHYANSSSSA